MSKEVQKQVTYNPCNVFRFKIIPNQNYIKNRTNYQIYGQQASQYARPTGPPYRMMPHPHPPPPNGPKTTGSNVNHSIPNMGSNMVYMQYPMGP